MRPIGTQPQTKFFECVFRQRGELEWEGIFVKMTCIVRIGISAISMIVAASLGVPSSWAQSCRASLRGRCHVLEAVSGSVGDGRVRRPLHRCAGPRAPRRAAIELAAVGYNFSLLLRWFEELLRALFLVLLACSPGVALHLSSNRKPFFTTDSVTLDP